MAKSQLKKLAHKGRGKKEKKPQPLLSKKSKPQKKDKKSATKGKPIVESKRPRGRPRKHPVQPVDAPKPVTHVAGSQAAALPEQVVVAEARAGQAADSQGGVLASSWAYLSELVRGIRFPRRT